MSMTKHSPTGAKQRSPLAVSSDLGAVLPGPRLFSCMFSPPPSANKIWRSDRGRAPHKSAEYDAWLDAVGWKLAGKAAREDHKTFVTPVEVTLTIPKHHGLSDLDNRIKPCLDALQRGCVLKNDNLVHKLTASWRPKSYQDQDQEQVWVTVTEMS